MAAEKTLLSASLRARSDFPVDWKRSSVSQTQSPGMISGLCCFATSLWLHVVALAQRMPVCRYRRRGRAVVGFVYSLSFLRYCCNKRRAPRSRAPENAGFRGAALSKPEPGRRPRPAPGSTDKRNAAAYKTRLRRAAKSFKQRRVFLLTGLIWINWACESEFYQSIWRAMAR